MIQRRQRRGQAHHQQLTYTFVSQCAVYMQRVYSPTNASELGWKTHGLALHSSCWSNLQICFPGGLRRLPQPAGERESALHSLKATTIGQHLIPCFFYHFYQPRRGKPRLLSPTLQSPMACSTQAQNPVMHPQKLWLYNPILSHEKIQKKKFTPNQIALF